MTGIDIPMVERLLAANPQDGGAWSALGVLLRRAGRAEGAAACQFRALEHAPAQAGIWSNLGNVLTELGQHDRAVAAHARATALAPGETTTLFNQAIGCRKSADFAGARRALDRLLRLAPDHVTGQWERALTLLQTGDYARGLPDYEVRRQIPSYRNRPVPGTPWDGRPLEGRTLFLSTEQGFGDALLAARFVPLVRRLAEGPGGRGSGGGRIVMECHAEQRRLLSELPVDGTIPAGAPFPAYDVHASLMSLPWLLGTTPASLPPPVPIHVPDASREKALRLVGPPDGRRKVGIVWSGRVTFADNARRATTLNRFLRFAGVPGVRLFSLQKGPPEAQLAELGTSALVTPLGPHFDDFADTAAVLERLDLIVMTDSSVAHLAGSLGRPVWNLVQYVPYWIYGTEADGEHTPWYPSMRLFRQGRDEDWDPVFARVEHALARFAATGNAS